MKNQLSTVLMKLQMILVIFITTFWLSPGFAVVDDQYWSPDFYRQGIFGQVNSLLQYDSLLILGGSISAAGDLPVQNIVTFDGQQWGTLGTGINGEITTLLEYEGDLIAAGHFSQAGDTSVANIARWDGERWHALSFGSVGTIADLYLYAGKLVALGDFSHQLGPAASKIAIWDGSNWSSLAEGPGWEGLGGLSSVTVHDSLLVVAGQAGYFPLTGPAVWDGTAWSHTYPYPGNMPGAWNHSWGQISTLGVYQGELIAGGNFFFEDQETGEYFSGICRWDGECWQGLNGGLWAPNSLGSNSVDVFSLLEYDGNLIVVGVFWEMYPAVDSSCVAVWTGSSWQSMDTGFLYCRCYSPEGAKVKDIALWNGQLAVGGSFHFAGALPHQEIHNMALWQNNQWQAAGPRGLGLHGQVQSLLEFNGQIIAAGSWENFAEGTERIARFGVEGWESLGLAPNDIVHDLILFDDRLVIGGSFSAVGGLDALHVAVFDGLNWQALGEGVPEMVEALAVYAGELFAGPYRWDGITWTNELQTNGPVHALQVWEGNLFAGGSFTMAGDIETSGIAGWNSLECFALGQGVAHTQNVYALTTFENDLIVGGSFTVAGGVSAVLLARWNGQQWSAFSDSLALAPSNYGVFSLATHGQNLFAGGRFIHTGIELNLLGRWDGNSWNALGAGIWGRNVHSLLATEDCLWVGGIFDLAGSQPAFSIGRWFDTSVFSNPSEVTDQVSASVFHWDVFPNPFNPRTRITFHLGESGPVDLAIYDLRGHQVAVLEQQNLGVGDHQVFWEGADEKGQAVPSGTYFIRFKIGSSLETKKVVLVR